MVEVKTGRREHASARARARIPDTNLESRCTEYILVPSGRRVKLKHRHTHKRSKKRTCCGWCVPLTVGAVPAAFVDVDRRTQNTRTRRAHSTRHPRAHPHTTRAPTHAHHPCTHPRTHAPTMFAHNTPTPALPTHPPTMHLLASSHVDVTHGIRHRVRGRCARHTRTFHTSHTDSIKPTSSRSVVFCGDPPGKNGHQ